MLRCLNEGKEEKVENEKTKSEKRKTIKSKKIKKSKISSAPRPEEGKTYISKLHHHHYHHLKSFNTFIFLTADQSKIGICKNL